MTKFLEKTEANFPSWKAAGITAGLTVSILAKVTPPDVPKADWVKIVAEEEASDCSSDPVLANTNPWDPLTLNADAPPLSNPPSPNNWASAEDDTVVDPPATEVYDINGVVDL